MTDEISFIFALLCTFTNCKMECSVLSSLVDATFLYNKRRTCNGDGY